MHSLCSGTLHIYIIALLRVADTHGTYDFPVEIRRRSYILHGFILIHCIYLTLNMTSLLAAIVFSTLGKLLALQSISKPVAYLVSEAARFDIAV